MSGGTRTAVPVAFDSAAGPCTGWFHAGASPRRSSAVVLCQPMGYEALCSYRTYTQLAQTLAQAGFDVLRFDYHGTGDSPGGDTDEGRVEAWLASIEAAAAQARALSGASSLSLFGLRLGATLAIEAAARMGGVDDLMLWAPCASGRAFVREMRAANAGRGAAEVEEGLEALGMFYSPETLDALSLLGAEPLGQAPAKRILVIGRDDMPGEGPLPKRFAALGADVTCCTWPGYAGMMAEPHEAVLAPETLDSITDWLAGAHPPLATTPAPEGVQARAFPSLAFDGICETPVRFGSDGGLLGVLAEPVASAASERAETAILMLNVGGNYRIGPNRNYVKWSRALAADGFRALRLDVAGIGDSRTGQGFSSESMYRQDAVADVRAAIDLLAARGCRRIWLLGICSGSYLAFETALADARVHGQILMNSRLLEWDAGRSGPWQSSMQSYLKSTRYYRSALLKSEVYGRLLRGQVNVRGIAGRVSSLMAARVRRALTRMLHIGPPQEGVLRKFRHLAARGVDTLVVMSAEDDGLDYMEFHLGPAGAAMQGHANFRMALVEDSDHTFATVAGQHAALEVIRDHLARLDDVPSPTPVLAGAVAIS